MVKHGVTVERVIQAAYEILDADASTPLQLAAVAQRLGVQTPSLYKHIDGRGELIRLVKLRSRQELAGVLATAIAGRSGKDALRVLAVTYRQWAREYRGRYLLTLAAPNPADADDQRTAEVLVDVMRRALSEFELSEDSAVDAVRALRAILHGFVDLESQGAFALVRPVAESHGVAIEHFLFSLTAHIEA